MRRCHVALCARGVIGREGGWLRGGSRSLLCDYLGHCFGEGGRGGPVPGRSRGLSCGLGGTDKLPKHVEAPGVQGGLNLKAMGGGNAVTANGDGRSKRERAREEPAHGTQERW